MSKITQEQLDDDDVAMAAALDGRLPAGTNCAVAVASGGNVDPEMFARALAAGPLF